VVPALGIGALGFLSVALLVGALPATVLRWFALLPAGIGVAFAANPARFDIYVDRDGAGAAIRSMGGRLTFVGKTSSFVREQWLRADGDGRAPEDASLSRDARCDQTGCVVEAGSGRHVAFVQDLSAFEEDCRRAAIVITRLTAPSACGAALVLDRSALAARGATAIRLGTEGIEISSVRKGSETRSWPGRRTAESANPLSGNGPRAPRPVPEQDFPEEEISSGEPD
jgi:competence protein ComEC